MVISRHASSERSADEEDEPQGILTINGRPVFFYLYGTNEPEASGAIGADGRKELTNEITQNGGQVCNAERDADTILVEEAGLETLKDKYEYSRNIYVESPEFVQACIAQGAYRHQLIPKRPIGGRHPGRLRTVFTPEDDMHLCRWIASTFPEVEAGGRLGIKPYLRLVEKAYHDDLDFKWAARHPADSWRERYKTQRERLDPIIDALVKANPPPADGKGVWPYDRRVNHRSIYARISRLNAMEIWHEEGELDDEAQVAEEGQVQPPQEQGQAAPTRGRPSRTVDDNWPPHRGSRPRHTNAGAAPRASAPPVEDRRGRVQSAPYPPRSGERMQSMSQDEMGEFAEFMMDDIEPSNDEPYRPGPEDAGPSGTQRTPPDSPAFQKPPPRPAREAQASTRTGPVRQRAVAGSSQMPMSSQATLVGPVPTQLRGASAAAIPPPIGPIRRRTEKPRVAHEEEEDDQAIQRAAKRRRIRPMPEPPAVELQPLRRSGRGARSALQQASQAAGSSRVAKAAPQKPAPREIPKEAEEEEEEEEEEEGLDDEGEVIEYPEDDVFAPEPEAIGPTFEDEQEVEELVHATAENSANISLSHSPSNSSSEVLDSDDQRTRARLRPSRAQPPMAHSRTSSLGSKRQLLITRLALEDDDEDFADNLDLIRGAAPQQRAPPVGVASGSRAHVFVTPAPRISLRREGTDASSVSSIPGVPLDGTRASEEKRRVRESQRYELYVPPPGSRAAESAQKMQLRSRTVVRKL
ncbi:hypothetical protein ACG7TL_002325 [Trametes sanguinea]